MQPSWPDTNRDPAADLAACRAMMRGGSRSFFAASLLLPRHVHEPATALYAFCRLADDAVDVDGVQVATLRARLRRAYDGDPLPVPADRALAAVVMTHGIPAALPEALLEGFEWDAEGRRYADLPALLDYAARVAGSVGAMMAMLMGARSADVVARACDLGVAMQLSNIARDVGEDARNGRLYLPEQWLREAGIDPDAWLARPVFSKAIGDIVARLLGEADLLYARAGNGIACLKLSCRPGIGAARLLYAAIGREVLRLGGDSVSGRAVVSSRQKLLLLARAIVAARRSEAPAVLPCLEAVQFLVDAVATAPPVTHKIAETSPAWRGLDDRIAWLVNLFERLGEREQVES